jgi:hypothetical protein
MGQGRFLYTLSATSALYDEAESPTGKASADLTNGRIVILYSDVTYSDELDKRQYHKIGDFPRNKSPC